MKQIIDYTTTKEWILFINMMVRRKILFKILNSLIFNLRKGKIYYLPSI